MRRLETKRVLRTKGFSRPLVLTVLAAGAASTSPTGLGPAGADELQQQDCRAVNRGLLNVELAAPANTNRSVRLRSGDVLTVTVWPGSGSSGEITLVPQSGASQQLVASVSGKTVSHTVDSSGDFGFRFASEGSEGATFFATCAPAGTQKAADARRTAALARGMSAAPNHEHVPVEEAPSIDLSTSLDARKTAASFAADASSALDAAADRRTAPAPKLEWEGTRTGATADDLARNLGVRLKLQPAIMVGVLAQFEQPETMLGPRDLLERNWLAGPVTSMQVGAGLSLDARAAWGADGQTVSETHAAHKSLVEARLTSKQQLSGWQFSPSVGVNYLQERRVLAAANLEDSSGTGAHTVGSGRVDIKPEFGYRIDTGATTFIEPKAAVGAFWDISDATSLGVATDPHARLKAEASVTVGNTKGSKVQIGAGIEEGAPNSADVWTGRLQLNAPLQ